MMKEYFYSKRMQLFITGVIVLNAVLLGVATYPEVQRSAGHVLELLDWVILGIFTLEVAGRLYFEKGKFFRSGWNWFDFIIVIIGYLPDSGVFTVLRILRVLRLFRLFSVVPNLRMIVDAMIQSLPSLGWVVVFALLLNYVFAIIGFHLYGHDFPKYFGDLPISMYTMFEMMTRAGWNTLARMIGKVHPDFYYFILPYILVASYVVLNLIMGVLVNSMRMAQSKSAEKQKKEQQEKQKQYYATVMGEFAAIKERLARLEQDK